MRDTYNYRSIYFYIYSKPIRIWVKIFERKMKVNVLLEDMFFAKFSKLAEKKRRAEGVRKQCFRSGPNFFPLVTPPPSLSLTKFISFLQSRLPSVKNDRFAERVVGRHERIRIDSRGSNATKNPSLNPVAGTGNRIACCEDTDRYPIAFPSNRVMQRACHIRNLIPTFVVCWTFQAV